MVVGVRDFAFYSLDHPYAYCLKDQLEAHRILNQSASPNIPKDVFAVDASVVGDKAHSLALCIAPLHILIPHCQAPVLELLCGCP